ncbi:MAG TPA: lantibiotic immunity ABC transporter MutE/EpiE family permease subunit [Alicyclobacillus sp.]|nr:lantibiotic immunity ABC transporter MutE/EpiE family permease subunit [Alicyclobacillus sp.]
MLDIIQSEHLKYKRTLTRRLILLAPLFFILIALPQELVMPPDYVRPWRLLLSQVYNWWPVIFMPLGTALFASLVALQEKKAGNYRNLRVHPVSSTAIWTGKIILMAYYSLLSTLVLIIAIVVSGLITAGGTIPWSIILPGGLLIWLTSLSLIPLQLCAAVWKGTIFSMAVGFLGMVVGVAAAPGPYWMCVPWSWPTRLMCPVVGVHPNGVLLEASDPLKDPAVIPIGIVLAITAFVLFTWITSLWFKRREVNQGQ